MCCLCKLADGAIKSFTIVFPFVMRLPMYQSKIKYQDIKHGGPNAPEIMSSSLYDAASMIGNLKFFASTSLYEFIILSQKSNEIVNVQV